MTQLPDEQIADASKLTADGIVELFHIILQDGSHLYLKANNDVEWQGHTWEGVGIKMGTISNSSDQSESSRPQLVVANPMGVFSSFMVSKKLDRAEVIRLRVLRQHIESNQAISSQTIWKVMRVIHFDKKSIVVELRNQMDGPNFITPARMYMPPEFPTVTL